MINRKRTAQRRKKKRQNWCSGLSLLKRFLPFLQFLQHAMLRFPSRCPKRSLINVITRHWIWVSAAFSLCGVFFNRTCIIYYRVVVCFQISTIMNNEIIWSQMKLQKARWYEIKYLSSLPNSFPIIIFNVDINSVMYYLLPV